MASIISDLPDDLLWEILCFLSLKQRATASLVSRKWHHIITSLVRKHSAKRYCGYCNHYPHLILEVCAKCNTLSALIKLAADNTTLTELYLLLPFSSAFFPFSPKLFESRLLRILHLKHCSIEEKRVSELPCLKEICFDGVDISSTALSKFISKCPSIVELTLIHCYFLYSISVPHQNQLRKVHVDYDGIYLQAIEIKAQNLMEFHLIAPTKLLEVDLNTCTKLQVLELDCQYIPIQFPEDISSMFPHLKSLSLRSCKKLKKIKLLSRELENLFLRDMLDLDDAVIDTPNLRSFKLMNMEKVPSWTPVVGSRLMVVEIGLKNVPTTKSLLEMRTFAANLGENVKLSFDTTESKTLLVRGDSSALNWSVIQELMNFLGPIGRAERP